MNTVSYLWPFAVIAVIVFLLVGMFRAGWMEAKCAAPAQAQPDIPQQVSDADHAEFVEFWMDLSKCAPSYTRTEAYCFYQKMRKTPELAEQPYGRVGVAQEKGKEAA